MTPVFRGLAGRGLDLAKPNPSFSWRRIGPPMGEVEEICLLVVVVLDSVGAGILVWG